MAFPDTPLDVQADLKVAGQWQNITADVYTRDLMTIVRGRRDEGSRSDPGKCTLTFNNGRSNVNPDVLGRYSQDNPRSDLYGVIGRNTQVRVHLPAAEAYLQLDGDATGTVSTPHVSALDITGDIDIRVELDVDMTDIAQNQTILGKWGTSVAARSWALRYINGNIVLDWINGSALQFNAFVAVELYGGRALRVTLDVDNGASGYTVRFYQADSIDGPWTQLFGDLTSTPATVIQSSTSPVTIGITDPGVTPPRHPFTGTATRFQVRSGIDGTLVADADFRSLADGATGFTDSAGRVWTVNGTAEVRKRADRLVGEISSWPPRWDVSGNDAWVPVEAAGILRRYRQGAAALQSPLRRRIPGFTPLAYWPMEEGAQATQASSPIPGVGPLTLTRVNWASNDSLISSAALPVWAAGSGDPVMMRGSVPPAPSGATGWQVAWLYRLDSLPATLRTIMRITTTGTIREWRIQSKDSQSKVLGYDVDGTAVVDQTIATANDIFNVWVKSNFRVSQSGGTVTWSITWADVGGDAGSYTDTLSGTIGNVTSVGGPPDGYSTEVDGLAMGHIGVFGTTTTNAYNEAITAWTPGENAGERALRLAQEENLPFTVRGIIAQQEVMGAQRMLSLLDLIGECADSDGGILMEHRSRLALHYRGRGTLYSQTPALTLSYDTDGEIAPPLEPVTDDAGVVNDVTVTRIDGSSGRVVLEEGPLSVQTPPDGIGRYDTSVQRSLADDSQAEQIAAWMLHLGTWGATRYPVVHVNLAAAPHLIDTVLGVDQGDVIRLTDLPEWLPPGDVDLIVQGYTESFDQYAWDIYFTCTPAEPWNVAALAIYEDFSDATLDVTATNGGNASWARSQLHYNSGTWSLRSGAITNNQTSDWIVTVPAGSIEMRFWYWTSSEASGPGFAGDRLIVLVDGVQVLLAQGTTPWTQKIVDVTGASSVIFRYAKDNSASSGEDAVHIDDLEFTGVAPVRVDTDGSTLAAAVTTTSTSLQVATTALDAPLWTRNPIEFPFLIAAAGEVIQVGAIASRATDTYARTVAGGWGTADSGQLWAVSGGAGASDFSVGSGYGSQLLSTVDVYRQAGLDHTYADADVYVSVTTSATATGGSLYGGPVVRFTDASNLYHLRIQFSTSNTVVLDLRKRVAGTESSLATFTTTLTHVAGTFIRSRLQVRGTTLRAKAWAVGTTEPDWQITVTDTSLTTSVYVGCRSIASSANTNVSPVIRYDDFEVVNPQTFSPVVRSVNGIVKAQAAATSIALALPAHIAL